MNNSTTVYTESYIILEKLNLLNSIPLNIYELIKNNYNENINFKYIDGLPLEYQPLSRETKIFLTYLYIKYICKSSNEKEQYKHLIIKNTQKNDTKKKELYNFDSLFKKSNTVSINTETSLIEKKALNFWQKFFNKIKNIIKK